MRKLTKKQKRMQRMVADIKGYISTYDGQVGYLDYSDDCFISDIVYGLGIAIDPKMNAWAMGFIKFKKELAIWLESHKDRVN